MIYFYVSEGKNDINGRAIFRKKYFDLRHPGNGSQFCEEESVEETITDKDQHIIGFVFADDELEAENHECFTNCFECE
jgi:hypothetical protein